MHNLIILYRYIDNVIIILYRLLYYYIVYVLLLSDRTLFCDLTQHPLQSDAGDPVVFKKYKVVKTSDGIKMEDHFNTAEEKRLIKSDLIVEVCQDYSKLLTKASIEPLSDNSESISLQHI